MNNGFVSFWISNQLHERNGCSVLRLHTGCLCLQINPYRPNLRKPLAEIVFLSVVSQLQDYVTLVNPGVSQLCIRGDGKLLASAGWDHRVRVFGWKKLRPLAVLQYHSDMVQSVAFSDHQDPRQRLLAAGSKDQRISLWSIYNEGADTG